jgi:hypothetical protein
MRTLEYTIATMLMSILLYFINKIIGIGAMEAVGFASIIITLGFIERKLRKNEPKN